MSNVDERTDRQSVVQRSTSDSQTHPLGVRPERRSGKTGQSRVGGDPCPECSGQTIVQNHDTFCPDCGVLIDDRPIERSYVWSDDDQVPRRQTGPPSTAQKADRRLATCIGWKRDGKGNVLPGATQCLFGRLRRWNWNASWAPPKNRSIGQGLHWIKRLVAEFDVGKSFGEESAVLFRRAHKRGLAIGRSLRLLATACVYAVSRLWKVVLLQQEIVDAAGVRRSSFRRTYSKLRREFGLPIQPVEPWEYVAKLGSEVEAPHELRARSVSVCRTEVVQEFAVGRKPAGVAASVMYLLSRRETDQRPITQRELAGAAGVSVVTLRSGFQALDERLDDGLEVSASSCP